MIEHAMTHQRKATRIEQLVWQIRAVGDVVARVKIDDQRSPGELPFYQGWMETLHREYFQLLRDEGGFSYCRI